MNPDLNPHPDPDLNCHKSWIRISEVRISPFCFNFSFGLFNVFYSPWPYLNWLIFSTIYGLESDFINDYLAISVARACVFLL